MSEPSPPAESRAPAPAMADFKPVVGGAGGKRFRLSRSVVVLIVIGAHVVAGALFAIPVIQRVISEAAPPESPGPEVALVDMVISEQREEAARLGTGSRNRPPTLKKAAQVASPLDHARRAGIAPAGTARALLLVLVDVHGKPGDVTVVESTGDTRLDQAAIDYARTLEWQPAVIAGREAAMSVRLPVEFAGSR
jgi:TonB family protein